MVDETAIGKIWKAIEAGNVDRAKIDTKLNETMQYQRQRNHDMLHEVSKVDAKVTLIHKDLQEIRSELASTREAEVKREGNMFKAGVVFLGGVVLALIGYIWQGKIGH